jgi:hypothetical protein
MGRAPAQRGGGDAGIRWGEKGGLHGPDGYRPDLGGGGGWLTTSARANQPP